jgi:hypothetical protein
MISLIAGVTPLEFWTTEDFKDLFQRLVEVEGYLAVIRLSCHLEWGFSEKLKILASCYV